MIPGQNVQVVAAVAKWVFFREDEWRFFLVVEVVKSWTGSWEQAEGPCSVPLEEL